MSEVILFKNSNGNVAVVTPSLKKVDFINGKFHTKDKALEAELAKLAETNDYGVYIDSEEASIDADISPMEALRAKLRAEWEAEKNNPPTINAGNTQPTERQFVSSVGTTADSSITGGTDKLTPEQEAAKLASQTPQPASGAAGLAAALARQQANKTS